MELRCPSKKHGEIVDSLVETKCSSRFCGAAAGVVVIHRFDATTGELVDTRRFKDPTRKEKAYASRNGTAVRSA